MFLVITGNFNVEEIMNAITQNQDSKDYKKLEKIDVKGNFLCKKDLIYYFYKSYANAVFINYHKKQKKQKKQIKKK